jgi:hypothetical protein
MTELLFSLLFFFHLPLSHARVNANDVNIGFHLNYGYGTAVVLHSNGTLLATARVNSTTPYRETIKKLSQSCNQHLA